jgi:UDP-GlcNAc:undecaprenyl-phosphate/decaprenyl-phosphate GlcNAc-1-phosphate transferase
LTYGAGRSAERPLCALYLFEVTSRKARPTSSMSIKIELFASVICVALTLILCVNARTVSHRLKIMDTPNERKRHGEPTPLMGGMILLCAVLPTIAVATLMTQSGQFKLLIMVWAAAVAAMTLVGLADDRHALSARDRLIVSFLVFGLAAALVPAFNVRVLNFSMPPFELGLGTGWLAVIFTIICCVGLVNAINMADGKNGLVIGLCIGWIGILALRAPGPLLLPIVILESAFGVALVFNMRGKLFLGDGGAYGLATAIGLLSILIYNQPGQSAGRMIAAEELMLLFGVPVLDSFRLTYVRIKQGRSPMSADRDHLHHHLQDRLGWPGGLLVYWALALVPALAHIVL